VEVTHLDADLGQVHLHGQLLAGIDIGVVGLLEGPLQLMELVGGEGGPIATVFLLGAVVILTWQYKKFQCRCLLSIRL